MFNQKQKKISDAKEPDYLKYVAEGLNNICKSLQKEDRNHALVKELYFSLLDFLPRINLLKEKIRYENQFAIKTLNTFTNLDTEVRLHFDWLSTKENVTLNDVNSVITIMKKNAKTAISYSTATESISRRRTI